MGFVDKALRTLKSLWNVDTPESSSWVPQVRTSGAPLVSPTGKNAQRDATAKVSATAKRPRISKPKPVNMNPRSEGLGESHDAAHDTPAADPLLITGTAPTDPSDRSPSMNTDKSRKSRLAGRRASEPEPTSPDEPQSPEQKRGERIRNALRNPKSGVFVLKSEPNTTGRKDKSQSYTYPTQRDFYDCQADVKLGNPLLVTVIVPGDLGLLPAIHSSEADDWAIGPCEPDTAEVRSAKGMGIKRTDWKSSHSCCPSSPEALKKCIVAAFTSARSTDRVVVSLYRTAKMPTGHKRRVCYYSVRADRDVYRTLAHSNLSGEEFLAMFDLRSGYKRKGKQIEVSEVQPFESTLDASHDDGMTLDNLTPQQFEKAVGTLLRRWGYEVRETAVTGDGGIDLVAVNQEPIIGGVLIVQCKYYAAGNNVGEPAVRDLYGVVASERANKGVLITTSDFTPAAVRFAEGKQIDLINGNRLKSLIAKHVQPTGENGSSTAQREKRRQPDEKAAASEPGSADDL